MIKNLFKLDLRSLALARVFFGILTFFDIARRLPDLETFFTDEGLLPRWTLLEHFELNWRMSLLSLNGSYAFALFLAVCGMLASVFFALGWKTRISNIIVWLTIISFQARFPEGATSGGDMLIRIFLFWSIFLPMNARYSVDRAVSDTQIKENESFSVFTALWVVQIMLLYIMTFIYKWAPVYHTDFDAVWFMLQLDIFTTSFGKWLGTHYFATKFLTFISYALEIVGPLLLFIPWKRDYFRGIAVVSFWLFHIGIGLTLHLGNFVPICLLIWVGLIPTRFWDYLSEKWKSTSQEMFKLYYNQESLLSKKALQVARELFFLDFVVLVPSETQKVQLQDQNGKVVPNHLMVGRVLMTSRLSGLRFIGKCLHSELGVYLNEVKESGEVNLFGKDVLVNKTIQNKPFMTPLFKFLFETVGFSKIKMGLNKVEKFLGGFLLVLIVGWNIEGYIEEREWHIGSPFDEIMFTLQLNQGWAMFAPHPQRSDGWWVMEGELKGGKKWDALNEKEVSFDRPADIYRTYQSEDWRKFLDNLQASRDEQQLNLLGKHLCRTWNQEHFGDKALSKFKLHFMQEFTNDPKEPPAQVKKITLWNHNCF